MMHAKEYSLKAFATLYFLVISIGLSESHYDSLARVAVGFPVNLDNNQKILYSMGLLQYTYDTDNLKVHRNQDSVEILITNARLAVAFGLTRPVTRKFNINHKGALFILETRGTAQLNLPDGKRAAKNCQFVFTEKNDSKNTKVEEVVKEGLFKELQRSLGEELCDKILF